MAAASIKISHISSLHLPSPPRPQTNKKPKLSIQTQRGIFSNSLLSRQVKTTACCSLKSEQKAEENGTNSPIESFPSQDDADYLWKLAAGSVGGGAAVKYGSVLFPDLTKPDILQALLMISLPVLVAVLVLIKESRSDN